MTPDSILHYSIERKLGEGGIGAVFLATDTKLNRKVAIKFLSSDKASDPESRQRFLHEAKAEAMLSHPNIVTFHEIGEAEGRAFIVMEYIEGQSLTNCAQSQRLSVSQILDLVIQAGEGLQAAHEKGVIHRDIKPENIMVTPKGHVKLTDFGLARWKGATTITKTGTLMGTISYMSPEQAEGKKLDHRSDIFSLGVILYELLSGRRPFEGDSEAAVLYELVNANPQPLARYARDLPDDLQRIVDKALHKDRSTRYQTVADLLADLRSLKSAKRRNKPRKHLTPILVTAIVVAGGGYAAYHRYFASGNRANSEPKRIVVLPFRNLGDQEQQYFVDGMLEEVMSRLTNVKALAVVSRQTAALYRNTAKPLREIGKELGVEYVLEGTIRWQETSSGQRRVRMITQLARVSDDVNVWSKSYDTVLAEVFSVQSDIAQQVSENMGIVLKDPETLLIWERWTSSEEAYDFLLRGGQYFARTSGMEEMDLRLALDMYQKAIGLDPEFALACAAMSYTYSNLFHFGYARSDSIRTLAKHWAARAIELSENPFPGHNALAWYYYRCLRDYESALTELDVAYQDNRNATSYLNLRHLILRRMNRWDVAYEDEKRAVQLEPKSFVYKHNLAVTCQLMRRYAEAERLLDQVTAAVPDHLQAWSDKVALCVLRNGDTHAAREVIRQSTDKIDSTRWLTERVWLDILDGNYQQALQRVTVPAYDSLEYFWQRARIYKYMGDSSLMKSYFDSSLILLERDLPNNTNVPLYAEGYAKLSIACAGLGRAADAAQACQIALLLSGNDAVDRPNILYFAAIMCIMVGEGDRALNYIEEMLSAPGYWSVAEIRLTPDFAPLLDQPRFQALMDRGDMVF